MGNKASSSRHHQRSHFDEKERRERGAARQDDPKLEAARPNIVLVPSRIWRDSYQDIINNTLDGLSEQMNLRGDLLLRRSTVPLREIWEAVLGAVPAAAQKRRVHSLSLP